MYVATGMIEILGPNSLLCWAPDMQTDTQTDIPLIGAWLNLIQLYDSPLKFYTFCKIDDCADLMWTPQ